MSEGSWGLHRCRQIDLGFTLQLMSEGSWGLHRCASHASVHMQACAYAMAEQLGAQAFPPKKEKTKQGKTRKQKPACMANMCTPGMHAGCWGHAGSRASCLW